MIELVVVAVVVGLAGYFVRDIFESVPESPKLLESVEQKSSATFEKVNQRVQSWRDDWSGKNQQTMAHKFKKWVEEELDPQHQLHGWLLNLHDEALTMLVTQLDSFCTELNVELRWLLERKLANRPVLKNKVEKVVLDYCQACWEAVQIQPELQLFKVVNALQQEPANKEYQLLSQQLYTELVKQGLTPDPDPKLYSASDEERWQYVSQAIQQVAAQHPNKFETLLKALLDAHYSEE